MKHKNTTKGNFKESRIEIKSLEEKELLRDRSTKKPEVIIQENLN